MPTNIHNTANKYIYVIVVVYSYVTIILLWISFITENELILIIFCLGLIRFRLLWLCNISHNNNYIIIIIHIYTIFYMYICRITVLVGITFGLQYYSLSASTIIIMAIFVTINILNASCTYFWQNDVIYALCYIYTKYTSVCKYGHVHTVASFWREMATRYWWIMTKRVSWCSGYTIFPHQKFNFTSYNI